MKEGIVMDNEERIETLEKALLEYVKKYGFNNAARDYFIRVSTDFSSECRQLN